MEDSIPQREADGTQGAGAGGGLRGTLGRLGRGHLPIAVLVLAAFAFFAHGIDMTQRATQEAAAEHPWLQPDYANPIYWDENYYVRIAHSQAQGQWKDPCWGERPQRADHPVLARLIQTASIALFDRNGAGEFHGCMRADDVHNYGYVCYIAKDGLRYTSGRTCMDAFTADLREHGNPWAWRIPSVLWATFAVAGVALAARRLLGSSWAGVLCGGILVLDGLFFVQGRMATLDVFAAGFVALALYAATFPTQTGRLMAGLLLGLGFASKYTAFFAGIPVLLVLLWSHHRTGRLTWRTGLWGAASVALLPGVVWVLSYLPWWVMWIEGHGVRWAFDYWVEMQRYAMEWNQFSPLPPHPERAQPHQWFFLHRPMYYFQAWRAETDIRFIHSVPNPFVWWGGAAASLGGVGYVLSLLARDARASGQRRGRALAASLLWPGTGLAMSGSVALGNATMAAFPLAVLLAMHLHPVFALVSVGMALAAAWGAAEPAMPKPAPIEAGSGWRAHVRSWRGSARAVPWRAPGTPAEQGAALAMLLLLLAYASSSILVLQSFVYYFTVGVPFMALALGAFIWRFHDRPEAFGWLGGSIFLFLFAMALASIWRPEWQPEATYVAGMTATGVVGVVGLYGWAYPKHGLVAARVAMGLFLALVVAAFLHYYPILAGTSVELGESDEILRAVPWANR